jgi:hypothetical protein
LGVVYSVFSFNWSFFFDFGVFLDNTGLAVVLGEGRQSQDAIQKKSKMKWQEIKKPRRNDYDNAEVLPAPDSADMEQIELPYTPVSITIFHC